MTSTLNPGTERLISIDAFRALTLLLMIFVNDHGTLINIPSWMGHADAAADAMGFADVIFPAFLFIVGLSVPFAIQNRLRKGSSTQSIAIHIAGRAIALLVMGFFHVNLGNYSDAALLPRWLWEILITFSFFLIWLDYPKSAGKNRVVYLKTTGISLLVLLALLYVGNADGGGEIGMRPQWWGILGLIGWTYLISSSVFLFSKGRVLVQVAAFLFFIFFNCAAHSGWLSSLDIVKEYIWIVGDGSMPALTIAGVITALMYNKLGTANKYFWLFILAGALAMLAFGLYTRPLWGISKIRATPPWVGICTGISMISFAVITYLTEIRGIKSWYNVIKAAGTSTLTCYLIPYIHEAILEVTGGRLPMFFRTGTIGLVKSLIFSLCIVLIVRLMEKKRIRLKL